MILWGQSAGGGAVDSYAYAHPGKDAIVSGLIAASGAAPQTSKRNTAAFSKLAGFFNCGGLNGTAELACMQKVDPKDIQNVLQSGNTSVPAFGLVQDDLTIFANNTDRMEKGLVASVPLITGNTINEGAAFAPFSLNQTEPPSPEVLQRGLSMLACGVTNEVQ
jgi:carboxylesterase type B